MRISIGILLGLAIVLMATPAMAAEKAATSATALESADCAAPVETLLSQEAPICAAKPPQEEAAREVKELEVQLFSSAFDCCERAETTCEAQCICGYITHTCNTTSYGCRIRCYCEVCRY